VIANLLDELDGRPLDLYVMTHEHLDHVQGLFFAATKLPQLDFTNRFKVSRVWLTASAHPDYYETHPEAKKKKLEFVEMYDRLATFLNRLPAVPHGMLEILANNDPTKTSQCVEFLRQLNPQKTTYVFRGMKMNGTHPFKEAKLAVWAPEEDTSDYYGTFQPLDAGVVPLAAASSTSENVDHTANGLHTALVPPPGVDVGAFMNLVDARRAGIADNLLAIDKAANNSSIVFSLEWRGWRLLFPGDAEIRSWKTMHREKVLKPIHFLKVAHHGSHNGTPSDEILDAILPETPADDRNRLAAISTWIDTYSGIPHSPTNARLASRTELFTTLDEKDELFFDLEFPG
jgi:hypothetical protein